MKKPLGKIEENLRGGGIHPLLYTQGFIYIFSQTTFY